MDNILEVSGLRKSYGSFALKDVAFSLPEGCITGFIAFVVIIMASPILTAALLKMENMNFEALITLPPLLAYGGMVLAGMIFLSVSACLSVKFYDKADLA